MVCLSEFGYLEVDRKIEEIEVVLMVLLNCLQYAIESVLIRYILDVNSCSPILLKFIEVNVKFHCFIFDF